MIDTSIDSDIAEFVCRYQQLNFSFTLLFRVFLITIVLISRPRMIVSKPTLTLSVDSLTRRKSLVVGLGIYPASPEFRNQKFGHLLEGPWRCNVADVEPINIGFADPLQRL